MLLFCVEEGRVREEQKEESIDKGGRNTILLSTGINYF